MVNRVLEFQLDECKPSVLQMGVFVAHHSCFGALSAVHPRSTNGNNAHCADGLQPG